MLYLWFFLIILFIIAELATSISLVTIWFIPPAIVSTIMCYFNCPAYAQIIVFLALSIILLMATKPIVKKLRKGKEIKTNINALIGKRYKILSINYDNVATIKINDIIWSVKSDDKLMLDDEVEITEVIGNSFIVKKIIAPQEEKEN